MTISTLSPVGGLQLSQSIGNASKNLQDVISSIVSGQSDNANVPEASQLQAQTSGLKQVLTNLAQASSLTQVADGGVSEIQAALTQLQSLAQQASSSTLSPADQTDLNQQFDQTVNAINQIASGTTFNGQSLLDGSLSGSGALSLDSLLGSGSATNDTLSINNLSSNTLLAGIGNLSTTANASQALGVISKALNQVTSTAAAIGAFQQTVNFANASVDSAVINQQAATDSLSDTDIASASTQSAKDQVQLNAAIALAAQGNNLSSALLQLVS